jgi:hypothetical protein
MAKWCNDDVLDAALDEIRDNCNLLILCSAQPTDRNDAVNVVNLADVAMISTDFTKADGTVSGRKLIVAEKYTVTVDHNGNATHIAMVDAARLLYVTTCPTKAVVTTEPVNILTWDIEFRDPL